MRPGIFYLSTFFISLLLSLFVTKFFFILFSLICLIILISSFSDTKLINDGETDVFLLGITLLFYKRKKIYFDGYKIFAILKKDKIILFEDHLFAITKINYFWYVPGTIKEDIQKKLNNYIKRQQEYIKKENLKKDFYKNWDGCLNTSDSRDKKLNEIL